MKLAEMSWPEVKNAAGKGVALLPIAAIEQHGPHLAVSTDTALATAIAGRVEEELPKVVVLCPSLPYGSSHHHLEFPGTMSIGHETYTRVLVDLAKSLLHGGFRRMVFLNGHGGNVTPGKQALSILSQDLDDTLQPNIALITYWELDSKAFSGAPPMQSPALSHACEYETSMMLYIHPERVRMDRVVRSKHPPSNGYIPWEDDIPYRGVNLTKRFHFMTDLGNMGEPKLATPEKGKHLVEKAAAAAVRFVSDFKDWPLMRDLRNG